MPEQATLADIAANPDRISDLSPEQAAELRGALASLDTRLLSALLTSAARTAQADTAGSAPNLLRVPEAAERLSVPPRWLYRRADDLGFVKRIGPNTTRVDEAGLADWLSNGASPRSGRIRQP